MSTRVSRRLPGVLFGTWFVASVLGQKLWRDPRRRSRWDRLHLLLPDWRFFAPDPGVHDFHLLVRGLGDGTDPGAWHELTDVEDRRWVHAFWHPSQREEKAQFDVCAELFRFVDRRRRDGASDGELTREVQLSVSYLTLLSYASAAPVLSGCPEVQFMVVVSGGHEDEPPEVVFVSERHRTETPSPAGTRRHTEGREPDEPDRTIRA